MKIEFLLIMIIVLTMSHCCCSIVVHMWRKYPADAYLCAKSEHRPVTVGWRAKSLHTHQTRMHVLFQALSPPQRTAHSASPKQLHVAQRRYHNVTHTLGALVIPNPKRHFSCQLCGSLALRDACGQTPSSATTSLADPHSCTSTQRVNISAEIKSPNSQQQA